MVFFYHYEISYFLEIIISYCIIRVSYCRRIVFVLRDEYYCIDIRSITMTVHWLSCYLYKAEISEHEYS